MIERQGMFGGYGRLPDFWGADGERIWPANDGEWVFLGRAIKQIGRAIFGGSWKGREPAVDLGEIAAGRSELTNPLLAELVPGPYQGLAANLLNDIHRTSPFFEDDQRMETVVKILKAELGSGRLKSAYRRAYDGVMVECNLAWWNADYLRPRLRACRVDPIHPIMGDPKGPGACWIYIDADKLRRLVIELEKNSALIMADAETLDLRALRDAEITAYWTTPSGWPSIGGHVHLPQVFDRIGKSRFGLEWTKEEAAPPYHGPEFPRPNRIYAGGSDVVDDEALYRAFEDQIARILRIDPLTRGERIRFKEWSAACDIWLDAEVRLREICARRTEIFETMRLLAGIGDLKFVAWDRNTGEIPAVEPRMWNCEPHVAADRFEACALTDVDRWLMQRPGSEDESATYWRSFTRPLFVTADNLDFVERTIGLQHQKAAPNMTTPSAAEEKPVPKRIGQTPGAKPLPTRSAMTAIFKNHSGAMSAMRGEYLVKFVRLHWRGNEAAPKDARTITKQLDLYLEAEAAKARAGQD